MDKDFWKALLIRAWHAAWETAAATLPAAIIVTPQMIEQLNWTTVKGYLFAFLAWLLTAVFAGILSAIKSAKVGMPETQLAETLYALDNDPELDDDEDEFEDEDPETEGGEENGTAER